MQTYFLHGRMDYQIKGLRVSDNHPVTLVRWDALSRFDKAVSKGLSSNDTARIVGVPKATLYRWRRRRTDTLATLIPPKQETQTLSKQSRIKQVKYSNY